MAALEELERIARRSCDDVAAEARAYGRKAMGFFCSYIPEEILYAAALCLTVCALWDMWRRPRRMG